VDGDYHYDSRRQALLWNIDLIDDTNKSGSLEFVIPSAVSADAFFPVDVTFSAQHTLVDAHITGVGRLSHPDMQFLCLLESTFVICMQVGWKSVLSPCY
jgi:hypothetical protein